MAATAIDAGVKGAKTAGVDDLLRLERPDLCGMCIVDSPMPSSTSVTKTQCPGEKENIRSLLLFPSSASAPDGLPPLPPRLRRVVSIEKPTGHSQSSSDKSEET